MFEKNAFWNMGYGWSLETFRKSIYIKKIRGRVFASSHIGFDAQNALDSHNISQLAGHTFRYNISFKNNYGPFGTLPSGKLT